MKKGEVFWPTVEQLLKMSTKQQSSTTTVPS